MKINRTHVATAVIFALALAAGIFLHAPTVLAPVQPFHQEAEKSGAVSLTIQGLYDRKEVRIGEGETVLEMLQALDTEDAEMRLSTKMYPGMGALIDGINGDRNGAEQKYWQYKVNGVMPQIGAGQYALKNGDVVEWFFGISRQ